MSCKADVEFSFTTEVQPALKLLSPRELRANFRHPVPLLRALGSGETPDGGAWSVWLAEWGWTWAISSDACVLANAASQLWITPDSALPAGFDARMLALAVALQLKFNGVALASGSDPNAMRLDHCWDAITKLARDDLAEVLALALLRANADVFDFASVCPGWPAEVQRVVAERRLLADVRAPEPLWLRAGYALLGETFQLLRSEGSSIEDCQVALDAYTAQHSLPLAFGMAFWWEACYCLSERHAYQAAAQAQDKVEAAAVRLDALSGLLGALWRHQQGRLHYYAGNHKDALADFVREYQSHRDDLTVAAMLEREIANVLCDLACLDAGARMAEQAIGHARAQGQQTELFKSLGRRAEIWLRAGKPEGAQALHTESLAIQQRLGELRAPAQTRTYLGHVAVLQGASDQAQEWYDQAEAQDAGDASAPYLCMGRFALAARRGAVDEVQHVWNAQRKRMDTWLQHQTHVLPAAVCTLIAARSVPEARALLPQVVQALLLQRYVIEAIPVVAELAPVAQEPLLKIITQTLQDWQRALDALSPNVKAILGPLNGPGDVARKLRAPDFHRDPALRWLCYPMSLAFPVAMPA